MPITFLCQSDSRLSGSFYRDYGHCEAVGTLTHYNFKCRENVDQVAAFGYSLPYTQTLFNPFFSGIFSPHIAAV